MPPLVLKAPVGLGKCPCWSLAPPLPRKIPFPSAKRNSCLMHTCAITTRQARTCRWLHTGTCLRQASPMAMRASNTAGALANKPCFVGDMPPHRHPLLTVPCGGACGSASTGVTSWGPPPCHNPHPLGACEPTPLQSALLPPTLVGAPSLLLPRPFLKERLVLPASCPATTASGASASRPPNGRDPCAR